MSLPNRHSVLSTILRGAHVASCFVYTENHRAMSSQALKILVVADDRKVLRHMSKTLAAFGYQSYQAAGFEQAQAALEGDPPDMLIIDGGPTIQAALEVCRLANGPQHPTHVYTLLLVGTPSAREVTDALEAGVDDFLTKPIVYGEMLVRLRTGARALEFERRLQQQSGVDPLAGLPGRTTFLDRLRRALSQDADDRSSGACVVVDLDFLSQINRTHGFPKGDAVLSAVADELRHRAGDTALLASLGDGRYGVYLPGSSVDDAVAWADQTRHALADGVVTIEQAALSLTASFGVADGAAPELTAEDLFDRAEQALHTAKSSGRNCVVQYGEFDDDAKAWAEFAAPGKLFERTVARDVMTPCTLVLRREQTVGHAAALLHQAGLGGLPVVDDDGTLCGLITQQSIPSGPAGEQLASLHVGDVMTSDVPVYDEGTSFATLRDFFTRDSRSLVVIVSGRAPTGLVTPNSLAALSQPLSTESFVPVGPFGDTSDYLRVPDLCPLDEME